MRSSYLLLALFMVTDTLCHNFICSVGSKADDGVEEEKTGILEDVILSKRKTRNSCMKTVISCWTALSVR